MFREFGIPARIAKCETVEGLKKQRKKFNGKRNCYVSVYSFTEEHPNGKTNYDSAIINTVWFDFDHNKDVSKCLKDVRKLYNRYCRPRGLVPRIYYTGGRGFQLNIDFFEPLNLPSHLKRESIRDYLLSLKKKYTLTTLDEQCINNSITAMRRFPNTTYLNKKTFESNNRYCIQLDTEEMLNYNMEEIEALSEWPRKRQFDIDKSKNEKCGRDFLHYVCSKMGVEYTPTNSVSYLLSEINKNTYERDATPDALFVKPVRPCVNALMRKCIECGHSGHTENNVISTELINAGWKDFDISNVFKFIYDEPGGDYGWYTNDGAAGYQIKNLRAKSINRFSKNRLMQLNVCESEYCNCGKS